MATLGEAADAGYRRLKTLYKTTSFAGNFWYAGNTLHTMMNHLVVSERKDDDGVLEFAVKLYEDLAGPVWWRDDFGWWGNAFILTLEKRAALGYGGGAHDGLFGRIERHAAECFAMLRENWRETLAYSPSTDHGTRQVDITGGTANIWEGDQSMSGRNAVTNEGFLLLTQGLARVFPGVPDYADYRNRSARWFRRWIEMGGRPGLLNDKGLVLERPTGNALAPGWYWSGDQGLFALGYASAFPEATAPRQVIGAVLGNMLDAEGVLHEYVAVFEEGGILAGFISDYATGKGIFMRSIGAFIGSDGFDFLSDFVMTNADAVWRSRGADDQFTFNWNPAGGNHEPDKGVKPALDPLIFQTAGLDALDAALRIGPRVRQMPEAR